MASEAGMAVLSAPRDLARARRELAAAGYAGERVVVLLARRHPHRQGAGRRAVRTSCAGWA